MQGGWSPFAIYGRPALDKPPEAVVQALVVDRRLRRAGVGKAMMIAPENWARDCGFPSVALSWSVTRPDAHGFYEAIGYRHFATSNMYRKNLDEADGAQSPVRFEPTRSPSADLIGSPSTAV